MKITSGQENEPGGRDPLPPLDVEATKASPLLKDPKDRYRDIKTSSEAFEIILQHIGGNGRWQWQLFFVTSFCGIFTAFHNLAAAFLSAVPDHWCDIDALDNLTSSSYNLRNISIPWTNAIDGGGSGSFSSCEYYERDWESLVSSGALDVPPYPDLPGNVSTKTCDAWDYDHSVYKSTVVEEWNLVCSRKYLTSIVQSTYMLGVLVGAVILSELSDKFGRRTITLWSAIGMFVSSMAVSFVTDYVSFIIFRFLVAAFGSGMFLPCFVLLMESVGPEARTIMGMLYQGFFSVGFMLLPFIAYFVREWRALELCIAVPTALLMLYYWILPESPRWLIQEGRYDEAIKVLTKAAEVNGGSLPSKEDMDFLISKMRQEKQATDKQIQQLEEKKDSSYIRKFINVFKGVITLLRTPNMRRRCLIIFFAWFVVSMVYYGLTFSGGNINASVYLMVFFSGFVEIPSYLLVVWTLKKFGRRINLCVLFLICGASCLLILAVPKQQVWVNLILATIGKFFNSSAFALAYIFSAELVPTGVRNISVGTSSMCARIGSAIAPFIVDILGDFHYTLPSTVFGLLSVLAGLLALLLPETSKMRLPETVEEVEAMPR